MDVVCLHMISLEKCDANSVATAQTLIESEPLQYHLHMWFHFKTRPGETVGFLGGFFTRWRFPNTLSLIFSYSPWSFTAQYCIQLWSLTDEHSPYWLMERCFTPFEILLPHKSICRESNIDVYCYHKKEILFILLASLYPPFYMTWEQWFNTLACYETMFYVFLLLKRNQYKSFPSCTSVGWAEGPQRSFYMTHQGIFSLVCSHIRTHERRGMCTNALNRNRNINYTLGKGEVPLWAYKWFHT